MKGELDVKRLPKRNLPTRFGRKLSAAAKARATHICLDCGYIYTLKIPFDEQDREYVCPQCAAPRSRFAKYDAENDKIIGGNAAPVLALAVLGVSVVGIAYAISQAL